MLVLNCPLGLAVVKNRPGWVLPAATSDLDFVNSRFWAQGNSRLGNLLSISRASTETSLLPSSASGASYLTFGSNVPAIVPSLGLQSFEARTNHLLNSLAPATQTTASLGTGTYTLWVNGSGSATSSAGTATGSGFGVATNGSPNTFTLSGAGTVTITVSGSLNAFQLEAGSFGTPLIITAGSTAARAADVNSLIGPAATAALAAKAAYTETSGGNTGGQAARIVSWSGGAELRFASSTVVTTINGTNAANATIGGAGTIAGLVKASFGFDASGLSARANGGTLATDGNAWANNTGTIHLGNNSGGNRAVNGYLRRVTFGLAKGMFDGMTV